MDIEALKNAYHRGMGDGFATVIETVLNPEICRSMVEEAAKMGHDPVAAAKIVPLVLNTIAVSLGAAVGPTGASDLQPELPGLQSAPEPSPPPADVPA
jgi:hypothetical protein